jgi:hypothetical protein
MLFEIKKREGLIIIAAVALNKDSSKATHSHAFIVIFNVRLEHGLYKIIILMNSDFEENFISQRFVKKNGLIGDPIKRIEESINGHTITIYRKYDLIIHIKDVKEMDICVKLPSKQQADDTLR